MLLDTQITTALQAVMSNANIRIFLSLAKSFLCVRYETTTRSLSRYSTYSLRHIFRFLARQHYWLGMRLRLFNSFFYFSDRHYILAVDEVVEDKSGHNSFGKGRFYSSCHQKVIPSVCFFALSLIDVSTGSSFLLHILQVFHTEEDKKRIALKKAEVKAGKARTKLGKNLPKGRKSKTTKTTPIKPKENLTASFRIFKELFTTTLLGIKALMPSIRITHLVADTAYGTLDYLKTALLYDCFLISKMKTNAVLYYPVVPPAKRKAGRPAVYGQKVDLNNIDRQYLKKTTHQDGVKQEYYQFFAYSKAITCIKLNIVVIITTKTSKNNEKNQISKNIWFTNDLNLDFQVLLEYYSLRFQIEFHFREAKQHFGLSDFKNYKEQNLTNFVNMSFTMCLVSGIYLEQLREETNNPKTSLLDLKIISNVRYMAKKIIKYLRITDNDNSYSINIDQYVPDETINKL